MADAAFGVFLGALAQLVTAMTERIESAADHEACLDAAAPLFSTGSKPTRPRSW